MVVTEIRIFRRNGLNRYCQKFLERSYNFRLDSRDGDVFSLLKIGLIG